jgi:hypothetical protein
MTFIAGYLLCVLSLPVALAFADTAKALHCLTIKHQHADTGAHAGDANAHVHAAVEHIHDDGAAHRHGDNDSSSHGHGTAGSGAVDNCCGYFCLSAMPAGPTPDVLPMACIRSVTVSADYGIAGRGPDRIDRPPIVHLPL